MNHIDTVLEGDPDDIVLREIRTNGSQTFANLVRFIGLSRMLGESHDG